MQLGEIKNIRCGEWDNSTWVVVPDGLTQEEFQEAVRLAKAAYEEVMAETPLFEQPFGMSGGASINELRNMSPNKTVAEILAEHDEKQERRKIHEDLLSRKRRSFGHYLNEKGLTPVQLSEVELKADANWGHRHGERIQYDGLAFIAFYDPFDDDESNELCGKENT